MERDAINWNVLYVRKEKKNDKYRSTKDGHKHLCTIMPEFQENDGLSTILFRST